MFENIGSMVGLYNWLSGGPNTNSSNMELSPSINNIDRWHHLTLTQTCLAAIYMKAEL
jgi:hypothetical protein